MNGPAETAELEAELRRLRAELEDRTRGETFFREILDSLPFMVTRLDLRTGVLFLNRESRSLTGRTQEEAACGDPFEGCYPDEGVRRQVAEAMRSEPAWRDFPLRTGDGRELWTSWNHERLPDGTLVAFGLDVTDARRAERSVELGRAEAEAANRAKNEFLANMSHEIRTPLNAIVGLADLLLESDPEEEHRGYLKAIQHSGEHLLAVVNDVLDVARIEAGRFDLRVTPFDLREVVDWTVRVTAPRARQKGLSLDVRIAPDVPRRLTGDADRLGQILLNLLGNAVKFTETGGVRLDVERGDFFAGDSFPLVCRVEDTGPGIAHDLQERIFAPLPAPTEL